MNKRRGILLRKYGIYSIRNCAIDDELLLNVADFYVVSLN